jgi:hypothetical protein
MCNHQLLVLLFLLFPSNWFCPPFWCVEYHLQSTFSGKSGSATKHSFGVQTHLHEISAYDFIMANLHSIEHTEEVIEEDSHDCSGAAQDEDPDPVSSIIP